MKTKTLLRRIAVLWVIGALVFAVPSAQAAEHGEKGHAGRGDFEKRQEGKKKVEKAKNSGEKRGKKTGWHGEDHPPGWSKGKKKGWDGQSTPPGQSR